MPVRILSLCLIGWLAAVELSAEEPDPAALQHFESKVRPVLVKHCYQCHSRETGKTESGLALDTRADIRRGGDRGPAVVPGQPEESWLLTAVRRTDPDLQMPPKGEHLSPAMVRDLETWIKNGAVDPRVPDEATVPAWTQDMEARRKHWAYQKPVPPTLPAPQDAAWSRRELDRFIRQKLEEHQLAPSPDAAPPTLLRRVHFDLIGLPPTPEDISRFSAAIAESGLEPAWEKEVDHLLASPHFGERWGRHWLDVARFAESSGKAANISFPYAWRYRDYVIDALNADLPYDRFLTEQLAGDLLPAENDREKARLLIATGYLAVGAKDLDEGNTLQFTADLIDEQIDSLTRGVLGNSVACARCHDHKFDPVTMTDYYALAGIFASTKTYFGTHVSPANQRGGDPLPLPRLEGEQIFHPSITAQKVQQLKDQLAALQKEQADGFAENLKMSLAGQEPTAFTLMDALRVFWVSGGIEGQLEKVDEQGNALPLAMGVKDGQVANVPLLRRGEISKPGGVIPRGFPAMIPLSDLPAIPSTDSGRLQLAAWLTHPDNPLTARVLVNRLWQHLLGAGLVDTVDNFGLTGHAPSHPELLDYLALRFVQSGWSQKRIIREIVLSRTYRQSSQYREEAFVKDPENRLLWRLPQRRLDAELIRDRMLAVSGELKAERPAGSLVARLGDRPISLIGLDPSVPADLDNSLHRSVYLPVLRDRLPDVLELFDFAEPSLVTGRRETTNVPLQALYLMNSSFVQQRAEALARRVSEEAGSEPERLRRAFLLCLNREPDAEESQLAMSFLTRQREARPERPVTDQDLLRQYCQALLCTAEFRILE